MKGEWGRAACSLVAATAILSLSWMTARGEPREAVPVDGSSFATEIASITSDWQVTLRDGERTQTVPAADIVAWGHVAELPSRPLIVMTDGSVLVGDVVQADRQRLVAESFLVSASQGPLEVPLELVAGLIIQPPNGRNARDALIDRIVAGGERSDLVVLANGDELSGSIQSIREGSAILETEVGTVDIGPDRLRAVIFNPGFWQRATHDGLYAVIGLADGSRLATDRVSLGDTRLEFTVNGNTWSAAPHDLACFETRGGRAVYVSDLTADSYRHIPFLELSWPYRIDRTVSGGALRAGGHPYLKGIGMHSAARITYILSEPFRRFQAEVAVDDETDGGGSVRFRVYADGQSRYAGPIVRGGQPPVPVSVDIEGVKRLDLIVDFADRADELDRADWLRARLIK